MNYVLRIILLLGACIISGCDNSIKDATRMSDRVYVFIPDGPNSTFIDHLALIVSRYKLKPTVGSATDDSGRSLWVLDAKGAGVHLRSENILLSGQEDSSKCGVHAEPYPDSGQYFISIYSSGAPNDHNRATKLLGMISTDLRKSGYDVASKPRLCSSYKE